MQLYMVIRILSVLCFLCDKLINYGTYNVIMCVLYVLHEKYLCINLVPWSQKAGFTELKWPNSCVNNTCQLYNSVLHLLFTCQFDLLHLNYRSIQYLIIFRGIDSFFLYFYIGVA